MASLYKRPGSCYWMLRFRDLESGAWKSRSLRFRHDTERETRKAERECSLASEREERHYANPDTSRQNPCFTAWVPGFIEHHYPNPRSRKRYLGAWGNVRLFLHQHRLSHPSLVRYQHAQRYLEWRAENTIHSRGHTYTAAHNTVLLELKFLAFLMNEAVRREFVAANPLVRIGIAKRAPKEKPALTDAQIRTLHDAAQHWPRWMLTAYLVGLYTGCRFCETEIPLVPGRVDFTEDTLTIADSKRQDTDPRQRYRVPLDPSLKAHLRKLLDAGEALTCKLGGDTNSRMNRAFRKAGVDTTFHSLRVTFISRCHEAGLSEMEAMRLVNHSRHEVHRIYSRMSVTHVQKSRARVSLPALA